MIETATKGDEQHACPRCLRRFVAGERIWQTDGPRGVGWTHIACSPSIDHYPGPSVEYITPEQNHKKGA